MKRTVVNLIIDLTAAFLLLGMIGTGYILRFPLPPGTNKSLSLWGLTRHRWGDIHFWISIALLGVLLAHAILHWQWIVSVVGKRLHLTTSSQPPLLSSGALTLSILVAAALLFAWVTHSSVQPITDPERFGVCPTPETEDGRPTVDSRHAAPTTSPGESAPKIAFWKDV